jgi:hypothetical protein
VTAGGGYVGCISGVVGATLRPKWPCGGVKCDGVLLVTEEAGAFVGPDLDWYCEEAAGWLDPPTPATPATCWCCGGAYRVVAGRLLVPPPREADLAEDRPLRCPSSGSSRAPRLDRLPRLSYGLEDVEPGGGCCCCA